MRSETQRKGEIAKLRVMLRAYEKGIIVSIPSTDADYDLIVDDDRLYRVQVKYADGTKLSSTGSVLLGLRRNTNSGKVLVYEDGAVDALAVYLPRIDRVIWLAAKHFVGKSSITIRYRAARNSQKKGILLAGDFLW